MPIGAVGMWHVDLLVGAADVDPDQGRWIQTQWSDCLLSGIGGLWGSSLGFNICM